MKNRIFNIAVTIVAGVLFLFSSFAQYIHTCDFNVPGPTEQESAPDSACPYCSGTCGAGKLAPASLVRGRSRARLATIRRPGRRETPAAAEAAIFPARSDTGGCCPACHFTAVNNTRIAAGFRARTFIPLDVARETAPPQIAIRRTAFYSPESPRAPPA